MTDDAAVRSLVSDAYQGERFTMTLSEIQEQATGRRRRRWVPALATGLAVIVAVTTWQLIPNRARSQLTADATFTHQCLTGWKPPNGVDDEPTERFRFGSSRDGLRVYTRGDILVECMRENGVTTVGTLYSLLTTSSSGVSYFAHHGVGGKPSYLIGKVPSGMTSVVAELSNGDTLPAVISDDLFAVWHPSASLAGARVKTSDKGSAGPISTGPSQPGPVYNQTAFDEFCRTRNKDENVLDLIVRVGSIEPELLYATESGYVKCSFAFTYGATGYSNVGIEAKDKRPWAAANPLEHFISSTGDLSGSDHDYVVIGRAPDGTTNIQIELSNGTILNASLHGILFYATWTASGPLIKTQKITATAGDKTYIHENDKTTVK